MPGEIKAKVHGQLLGNQRNHGVQLLVRPGTSPLSNRIRTGSLTGENQDSGTCNRERTRVPSVLAALGIYGHEPIISFVSPRIFQWWRPIVVKGLVYLLINLLIFAYFSLLQYWRQQLFLAAMPWGPNGFWVAMDSECRCLFSFVFVWPRQREGESDGRHCHSGIGLPW